MVTGRQEAVLLFHFDARSQVFFDNILTKLKRHKKCNRETKLGDKIREKRRQRCINFVLTGQFALTQLGVSSLFPKKPFASSETGLPQHDL
jgi:hypothetical protein